MNEHIVLLHGLWMRGFALALLDHRLSEQGYHVHRFDYMSVAGSQRRILAGLRAAMEACGSGPVHLVGHSLGGLLALRVCENDATLPPGRVVCLGSPLKGSAAARAVAAWGKGGEALLGHNRILLESGFDHWDGPREVGVIAGRMALGLGAVLGRFDGDNDGSVAVAETRLPGLTDHCVIEASHTGLLLATEVAPLIGHFLEQGRFAAGPA